MRFTLPLLATLSGCTAISEADWFERLGWWSGVSAEVDQSCGLRGDGTVDCWGALNDDWDDTQQSQFETASQHDAGYLYACVIGESGGLHCFGSEEDAEPGLILSAPTGDGWVAVSAGVYHACALDSDQRVSCWGQDDEVLQQAPTLELGQIDVGSGFACGITHSTGEVLCWGSDASTDGGSGRVSGAPGKEQWWYQVSAGHHFACAVGDGCAVDCWGADFTVPDAGSGCYERVEVGMDHACFMDDSQDLVCAGSDDDGQLQVPQEVEDWVDVDVGAHHSCGLTAEGAIHCWGNDDQGQAR